MRKTKVNRKKEFEEFRKSMSKYPKDFLLLKLFNLSKDFQDYINGKALKVLKTLGIFKVNLTVKNCFF